MATPQQDSKVDDLHRKIHEADEVAPQLTGERAKLEDLNDVESPISVLPPELLCLVFHFARPSGFSPQDALDTTLFCSLKSVSKRWRTVLLSSPAIWTEVDLRISSIESRRDATPLLTFIKHSGQLPLSVGLQYSLYFGAGDTILIDPCVDPFLLENLWRITHLRLIFPPLAWFLKRDLLKHVTYLTLYDVHSTVPPPLSLDQAVSLTVRSSPGIQLTSAPLITMLNLTFVPITSSLCIIAECPNLRKLYLSCRANESNPGLLVDPFTIPRLEFLHWNISILHRTRWYTALLNHLQLPSLQALEWEERDIMEYQVVGRAIAGFFSRLPITLTSLKFHLMLSASKWYQESTEDIYHIPPVYCHLESLEFNECSIRYFSFFLQNLQTIYQFPRLHTIKTHGLRWTSYPWKRKHEEFILQTEGELSQACLTMLRNRMNVPNRRFTLVLEKTDMKWWNKVEGGLEEFNSSGCQVEILRNGCTIVLNT